MISQALKYKAWLKVYLGGKEQQFGTKNQSGGLKIQIV